ncbi:MAG: hypothetical protein RL660_909 [Bacteroidota bacterium]|jgi:hypothetical protein
MIKNFTKQLFVAAALIAMSFSAKAQITVTVDPSATWVGYMNVFDLGMGYQFGGPWGLADVKTTLDVPNDAVILQPNFNTYDPLDAYWSDGAGNGNKIMEANSYVESTALGGQTVTFEGQVDANSLDAAYTATAFIKVLDPSMGYATVLYTTTPLPATGNPFTVSAAIPSTPGLIAQLGFTILGINANPANEAALGSISVSATPPLGVSLKDFGASTANGTTKLSWTSLNEANMFAYDIERSLDNKQFTKIGTVNATNNAIAQYTYNDELTSNVAYYRLKMIDNDGKSTYSKIVAVNNTTSATLSLLPNPATSVVAISGKNVLGDLVVTNSLGTVVAKTNAASNNYSLDVSTLTSGVYLIRTKAGHTAKFIKQ